MHLILYSDSSDAPRTRHGVWRWIGLLLFVFLVALIASRTLFFVDESEYVYVTQFGEPLRFVSWPGLQVKWPYQSLRRFDRRLQIFEPPARELLTHDKENLTFAWYVCWRLPAFRPTGTSPDLNEGLFGSPSSVAEASEIEPRVRRFLQAAGSVEVMESRLEERVQAAMAAEIGRLRFQQLASLNADQLEFQELGKRIQSSIQGPVADQFGIELVDVRLKRIGYPEAVKPAVFAEIRSERERVAVQYRAEGASEKAKIQSLANLQRDQLLAQAREESLKIRGAGEAAAIEIFNAAHGKDPKFYELLKTLETYRSILDDQTTVVLSADAPLLKLLVEGPPPPPNAPESPGPSPEPTRTAPPTTAATSESPPPLPMPAGGP